MRSALSLSAVAAILSATQAAPAVPGITTITNLLPGAVPTDPKALAAWAAARGLAFDPKYKHVPVPGEVISPEHVVLSTSGAAPAANNLTGSAGSLPSLPGLHARINGPDDRYQYTDASAFPWRSVGKVQWSNGVSCTGQLIGPRHVLTARHCIPQDGQQVSISFSPAYDNGPNPAIGSAQVSSALFYGNRPGGDCDIKIDSAVMLIDRRLGDDLGYFSAELPSASLFNQKIFTTLGYPGDRDGAQRPYRMDGSQLPDPNRIPQFDCDKTSGPIFSDTDVAPGQSGSALWKDVGTIWGVASVVINWSDGLSEGGWASGNDLINLINYSRQAWT